VCVCVCVCVCEYVNRNKAVSMHLDNAACEE
jgi:hypothetical protein